MNMIYPKFKYAYFYCLSFFSQNVPFKHFTGCRKLKGSAFITNNCGTDEIHTLVNNARSF